jgi:uncharacterized circularly permuted ATP-grasp superfamily protein
MLAQYKTETYYDEMFLSDGIARNDYSYLANNIEKTPKKELFRKSDRAKKAFLSLGITFKVYGDPEQEERIIPFDIIPRIVTAKEWEQLEKGLVQRTKALNLFIQDIYNGGKILKDKIVPKEFVYLNDSYLTQCEGFTPANGTWIHISGTDLVRNHDGNFHVLEDNLRCPSGVSYVLENREVMKSLFPDLFERLSIRPIYDYPLRLKQMLINLSSKENPSLAVLTAGIHNSAYYEHCLLAREMGVALVEGRDLVVSNEKVYMKTTSGLKQVDVIYRRIDDAYLDPQVFNPDSLLGVEGIFNSYLKGNVILVNSPGTGIADDKALYSFVPDIIKYYLSEDPIITNVPTYLCYREKERKYVLDNMEQLVVKTTNGSGGYGMLIGSKATKKEIAHFKDLINSNPSKYIAQPVLALSRVPTIVEDSIEGRHVDLRPFILHDKEIYVMPGGLTRVALQKGSLVVNSSQGGGTKDTWVMGK